MTVAPHSESLTLEQWVNQKDWPQLLTILQKQLSSLLSTGGCEVDDIVTIQWLMEAGWFAGLEHLPTSLLLFVKSFCARRAWFSLQQELLKGGWALEVGLLRVTLVPLREGSTSLPAGDSSLASLYMDLTNLSGMTAEAVDQQLKQFWLKYEAYLGAGDAYQILDAKPEEPWPSIVKKYRLLASNYHPDKGGNSSQFQAVQSAFEQLRAIRTDAQKR